MIDLTVICDTLSEDELHANCDSSCTTGYDNGGSTGLEIFENGISIGHTMGQHPEFQLFKYHRGNQMFFFLHLGENKLVAKLLERR